MPSTRSKRWADADIETLIYTLNMNIERIRGATKEGKSKGLNFASECISENIGDGCKTERAKNKISWIVNNWGPTETSEALVNLLTRGASIQTLPNLPEKYQQITTQGKDQISAHCNLAPTYTLDGEDRRSAQRVWSKLSWAAKCLDSIPEDNTPVAPDGGLGVPPEAFATITAAIKDWVFHPLEDINSVLLFHYQEVVSEKHGMAVFENLHQRACGRLLEEGGLLSLAKELAERFHSEFLSDANVYAPLSKTTLDGLQEMFAHAIKLKLSLSQKSFRNPKLKNDLDWFQARRATEDDMIRHVFDSTGLTGQNLLEIGSDQGADDDGLDESAPITARDSCAALNVYDVPNTSPLLEPSRLNQRGLEATEAGSAGRRAQPAPTSVSNCVEVSYGTEGTTELPVVYTYDQCRASADGTMSHGTEHPDTRDEDSEGGRTREPNSRLSIPELHLRRFETCVEQDQVWGLEDDEIVHMCRRITDKLKLATANLKLRISEEILADVKNPDTHTLLHAAFDHSSKIWHHPHFESLGLLAVLAIDVLRALTGKDNANPNLESALLRRYQEEVMSGQREGVFESLHRKAYRQMMEHHPHSPLKEVLGKKAKTLADRCFAAILPIMTVTKTPELKRPEQPPELEEAFKIALKLRQHLPLRQNFFGFFLHKNGFSPPAGTTMTCAQDPVEERQTLQFCVMPGVVEYTRDMSSKDDRSHSLFDSNKNVIEASPEQTKIGRIIAPPLVMKTAA